MYLFLQVTCWRPVLRRTWLDIKVSRSQLCRAAIGCLRDVTRWRGAACHAPRWAERTVQTKKRLPRRQDDLRAKYYTVFLCAEKPRELRCVRSSEAMRNARAASAPRVTHLRRLNGGFWRGQLVKSLALRREKALKLEEKQSEEVRRGTTASGGTIPDLTSERKRTNSHYRNFALLVTLWMTQTCGVSFFHPLRRRVISELAWVVGAAAVATACNF